MKSTGALIDAEILARATRKGYTFTQTPVSHYRRKAGNSTGANPVVVLRAFKELFKLRKENLDVDRASDVVDILVQQVELFVTIRCRLQQIIHEQCFVDGGGHLRDKDGVITVDIRLRFPGVV